MEARIGGQAQLFYDLGAADLRAVGKRSLEWDPSDWKWDGHLFLARPLNPNPSSNYQSRQFFPLETGISTAVVSSTSNSSSSCSDEVNIGSEKETRELEKRQRVIVVEEDNLEGGETGTLTLKLGERGFPSNERELQTMDGNIGKKIKLSGPTSNRAVCQVEDCGADLSKAKDYHRRHKVCEMHSKATKALVGNIMQRFCQQCSRFHALQEFDDGKRSCRRRLAGHNKRRRKTQPDTISNSNTMNDSQASGYLLMSLLKILANMHSNRGNSTEDQDLLSHLLKSLASQGALSGDKSISGILHESSNLLNNGPAFRDSDMISALISNGSQAPSRPKEQPCTASASKMPTKGLDVHDVGVEDMRASSSQRPVNMFSVESSSLVTAPGQESSAGRNKLITFDLNDMYVDSDDGMEDVERLPVPADVVTGSLECPSWVQKDSHQSSPPQASGHSDSGSAQSPSSSNGDPQSRTDRIVFKLFGKDPSEFPFLLRAQILDWLSHSPTDIESYIRPGCVILTIYLRLPESAWEELCCSLNSSLSRLLDAPDNDSFWRNGWIYVRVQNQIALLCSGKVLVETSLPFNSYEYSTIVSVKPIAVPVSERSQFTVKGFNLSTPLARLHCALEGNYLVPEASIEESEHSNELEEHHEIQSVNFTCSFPEAAGRGFIEVEDHDGLSSSFFPFIVAEEDVCSEIRTLENEIELSQKDYIDGQIDKMETRNQAMDFLHEMGWLLQRNNLKSRMSKLDASASCCFPLKRFAWLMEFSIDHNWCAVVKKLLDIFFNGSVGTGEQSSSLKLLFSEMGLLHKAVRRNSRPLVELLLRYSPDRVADELRLEYEEALGGCDGGFLFRPNILGPSGLTPLHVAAGIDGSEDVIDALTDDPGKVAIEAWKNARDSTGFTPEDYARLRGHYSYIHLVQRKLNRKVSTEHVVVDIRSAVGDGTYKLKQNDGGSMSFEVSRSRSREVGCRVCDQKMGYVMRGRSLLYKPAMLSMVAIAAVCVCVALLFKSSPEVLYVFQPFRWEMLDYGSS
nr:squamosa promoter-binding-like protein 12 [Ipomoea trifida]